mgnify:CR=1 FL=1
MLTFTDRAKNVSPSLTLAITAKANQMKAEGVDLISFAAGEPDFNTPEFICKAAINAINKGYTKYTAASGLPALKQAVCAKLKRDNNLDYTPDQIVVSTGAKQCLFNAVQAVVQDGDEVIIIAPYWLTYPELVKICGGKPVVVNTDASKGFMLDVAAVKKAITPKTKAIILNTPNNPTGTLYTEDVVREFAEMLKAYPDIWIISDEIYEALAYDGHKHFSVAQTCEEIKNRTIVINGMSKAYAMTGWRIGYSASTVDAAKRMGALQSHESSNANTIAQHASITALNDGQPFIADMRKVFEARRNALLDCFKGFDAVNCVKGNGAFYVMVNVSGLFGKSFNGTKIESALQFSQLLLENAHVAVIPCESFGAKDYIRLTYTLDIPVIQKGAQRIKNFIQEIK